MDISRAIAGFTLEEADKLRKACGKKIKELMDEVGEKFVAGAEKQGHSKEDAETMWGWIVEFADYGFNKSHALCYARIAYSCAYAKCHYPREFFNSMLRYSSLDQDPQQEAREIINECKIFGINVIPPTLKDGSVEFSITPNKDIAFGLSDIKGVGKAAVKKLLKLEKESDFKKLLKMMLEAKTNKTVFQGLIKSGALDFTGEDRGSMLKQYELSQALSPKEFEYWNSTELSIADGIKDIITNNRTSKKRIEKLKEIELSWTPFSLSEKIGFEKFYLGLSLSGDEADLYKSSQITHKCIDILTEVSTVKISVGAIIDKIKTITTKKGDPMAFMSISDGSFMIDSAVVFTKPYLQYKDLIEEGRAIIATGRKDPKDGGFIVDSIKALNK
jgi:DNA polymerase-3 subunit alpha